MRARHPFGRRDDHSPGVVTVTAEVDIAVTTVAVCGRWNALLRRDAFLALRKSLSEHPAALMVDLTALADHQAVSVPTWMTARRVGDAMAPPVRVVSIIRPETALAERLERLGAAYFLPTFATEAEARIALADGRPLTDRARLLLPPRPDSPGLARNLVTETCAAWQLPRILYRGHLVISELVANAVVHARSPISVVVTRRGPGLHLAVCDRDPRLPRIIEERPDHLRRPGETSGRGLRIVAGAASAWGALPTRDGKVVWATIR